MLPGWQDMTNLSAAWSGCVGGWYAVQAHTSGISECAGVVLAVCVGLSSKLSSTAANFCEEK